MITIAGLVWDNWFSYGEGNFLETNDAKVTQITGHNGTGKSSIPVIIGEILYGKNNLGKAKSKLFNRYLDKKYIFANLVFYKDEDKYTVTYERKSTLKLTLHKNEEDISSHTSTETYKTIANILGYDFNTFWNLIYQSSKDGVEFLTATDTARKKFLVKLFNLDDYITIHEFFKSEANSKNTDLLVNKGKYDTIKSWIEENEKIDLIELPILPIPTVSKKDIDELANLKVRLQNLHENNKKINENETFKQILSQLDTSILNQVIDFPKEDKEQLKQEKNDLWKKISACDTEIAINKPTIDKISSLKDKCPTCEQDIDQNFVITLLGAHQAIIKKAEENKITYKAKIREIEKILVNFADAENKIQSRDKVQRELTDLLNKIDKSLPNEVEDEADIKSNISILEYNINSTEAKIKEINNKNLVSEAHNSKIRVIKEQLGDYRDKEAKILTTVKSEEELLTQLNILKKAFSTNGLISYKIESLSTELEEQINTYLAELSKGRFQLKFTISGEKLNIDIIDDGNTIGVEELSAGELARVNTATLLAIRKLMAAISSNKINILFLDEITGVLDDEGKEVLIDILNSETELNTFLVSHEFTHPLIPRINIVKENKISKIEE